MSLENEQIYRELQEHLDKLPVGYPATQSGIEIKILKRLYTPEEARLTIILSSAPLSVDDISTKIKDKNLSKDDIISKFNILYTKGLIGRGMKEGKPYYANIPFLVGIFEHQLNNLTVDFIKDAEQYFKETFWPKGYNLTKIPQLRTIPIGESISIEQDISTYDDIKNILENCGGPIAVAECICRKSKALLGDPCKKTGLKESCFSFRKGAEIYLEKGFSREISKEEALDLLRKAEEDGLVIQPGNSQRPMNICTCCGCCCEVLTNEKVLNEPVQFFSTNFYAIVDEDTCTGCGVCEERCNMDAITIEDDLSVVDEKRCIGCGVCVPTCGSEAISLKKIEDEKVPPKNSYLMYQAIMAKKAELSKK